MGGEPADAGGSYQMGFELRPLTADGGLDTSLDFKGGPHPVAQDPLYLMSCENRETANRMVKEGQYEQAVSQYSELIVKTRTLESEEDVIWNDEARVKVRTLRATAYLNLSLCFLKLEQWTHASNTATRSMQGDKDPPDPKEDVLPDDKKAKALYRRAQAQTEGFGNFDKALQDLRKAQEYAPEDKGIKEMLRKVEYAVKKTEKKADKKMAGFLNKEAKSGEGLFDDSLRPTPGEKPKDIRDIDEPKKLSEGLWVVPSAKEGAAREAAAQAAKSLGVSREDYVNEKGELDLEKLKAMIDNIKELDPQMYESLRDTVYGCLEERAQQAEEEAEAAATEEESAPQEAAESEAAAAAAPEEAAAPATEEAAASPDEGKADASAEEVAAA